MLNKLTLARAWRGAALAVIAFGALAFPSQSQAAKTPDNLGARTSMISSDDDLNSTDTLADTAPTKGLPTLSVTQTRHYLHHTFGFWNANQIYTIKSAGTAEYVAPLDCWIYRDAGGSLYRFNVGSRLGVATAKPTVNVGARASAISPSDSGYVSGVASGAVSADGGTRTLNISSTYTHPETYYDTVYTLSSTSTATFVPQQNAHMAYVGNTLYRVDLSGNVASLREKPSVNIGLRASAISPGDRSTSWNPTVRSGRLSFNGQTRNLIVSYEYVHEETFQKLLYTLEHSETAYLVPEQNAHMAWINNNLYSVDLGSNNVLLRNARPVVNLGERAFKLDNSDPLISVTVTPIQLTSDNRSIVIAVRRNYSHAETYQIKEYYGQTLETARFDSRYQVWTVIVDNRIYAITFDGDVVNDNSLQVIHAPGGLRRPDVIVVSPDRNDPPVVVPDRHRPSPNDDPPVVVPGRHRPSPNDDPPVVVPGRHRPSPNDDPPVVVPDRHRPSPNDDPPVLSPGHHRPSPNDDPPVVIPGRR